MTQQSLGFPKIAPALLVVTEADVLGLLRKRHMHNGNGGSGEFAFLAHVRDGAAFDSRVTIDAVSVSLWPSRGLEIEGFEVKVSRGDWRRELAQPHKAEAACKVVDRFSVVAPRGVVVGTELPETWGLIEVIAGKDGPKLKMVKAAPLLEPGRTRRRVVSRDFLVGMLRSCPGAIPGGKLDPDRVAMEAERKAGEDAGRRMSQGEIDLWRDRAQKAEETIRVFERESGVRLSGHYWDSLDTNNNRATEVAKALQAVLRGDELLENARRAMKTSAQRLREHADQLDRTAGL